MFDYQVIPFAFEAATPPPEIPSFDFDERGLQSLNAGNARRRAETRSAYALLHAMLVSHGLIVANDRPRIAHHEHGKPYLADHPGLFFNLSHCRRALAAAISTEGEVGIDIESRRPVVAALVDKVCSPEEADAIAHADDPELLFLKYWTQKEALLKLIGTGIDRDLRPLLAPDNPLLQEAVIECQILPQHDACLSICRWKKDL
ncbi:MAG: 4'-phosphopantetheinyl transferase superfamily protein [Bacteroidales bacterium]|nr:4'-phosphopantetheinyl transferase superfamily protein [Bacteroidales bacterium]